MYNNIVKKRIGYNFYHYGYYQQHLYQNKGLYVFNVMENSENCLQSGHLKFQNKIKR